MKFEPIAIVGQSCVLPGANDPAQLWQAVEAQRDLLGKAPPGYWRIDHATALTDDRRDDDRAYADRGGYVRGFEDLFDPTGFSLSADEIRSYDPLVQWLLHCGRECLRDAGAAPTTLPRTGAVLGNLSYPSRSLSALTEAVWLDAQGDAFIGGRSRQIAGIPKPGSINRFMSGLPATLMAQGLGLGGNAFCLDAACASSLYAIALACNALHDGRADLMLAGGVNAADDLFIHVGFCALQAMSPSGKSRPFHKDADGLVPSEGAAVVALERLDDALRNGRTIYGLIRGVGLANDGRGRGLLVPHKEGQVRALRRAYEIAELSPSDVSLLECHATGTTIGDAVELETLQAVFAGVQGMPIGSLKSNIGHSITASGAAALQKVLAAMRAGVRPATLHADTLTPVLVDNPTLRVLSEAEPWPSAGPRRAGVSNFGFGGNNAHLIVEEYLGPQAAQAYVDLRPVDRRLRAVGAGRDTTPAGDERIAIIGIEVLAGSGTGLADFAADVFGGSVRVRSGADGVAEARAEGVELPLFGLRFPPADLAEALPQQVFLLKAMQSVLERTGTLPRERTGVLIGMQCDTQSAGYGARLRMEHSARQWATGLGLDEPPPGWVDTAKDAITFKRGAAGVIGAMPNIPANRLNSQFDLAGPSFTLSAEELSGIVGMELAARALRAREMDAMVVGAVDMACELVNRLAFTENLPDDRQICGDAAVVLILERVADARAKGRTIYATFDPPVDGNAPTGRRVTLGLAEGALALTPQMGHAHAASGLLHVAAGALACFHRASPRGKGLRANPWIPEHGAPEGVPDASVVVRALRGPTRTVNLYCEGEGRGIIAGPAPRVHVYSGADRDGVLRSLSTREGEPGTESGPARLVIVCEPRNLEARRLRAREMLDTAGARPVADRNEGIYFYPAPVPGETAFVFTGPAGAYHGMGRELLLAYPDLLATIDEPCFDATASWIYAPADSVLVPAELKLWGSSYLSQLHAIFGQVIGLTAQAAIGFCSGESNALFALGAWRDMSAMVDEIHHRGVFDHEIAGELRMLQRAWRDVPGVPHPLRWVNWRVFADAAEVARLVESEPFVRLTIINAPGDVVIGGDPEGVERVGGAIGRSRCVPIGYDVALHCEEAAAFEGPWRQMHSRDTYDVPGVRFYSVARCDSYEPTREACADAITLMSQHRVDFPAVIEKAYADGVRIFIEHGPRDGCAKWITRVLGDRPHVSVAFDRGGVSPVEQVQHSIGQLVAAGVRIRYDAFAERIEARAHPAPSAIDGLSRFYPAHYPDPKLPPMEYTPETNPAVAATAGTMMPAPQLPPTRGAAHAVVARAAPPAAAVETPPRAAPGPRAHATTATPAPAQPPAAGHRALPAAPPPHAATAEHRAATAEHRAEHPVAAQALGQPQVMAPAPYDVVAVHLAQQHFHMARAHEAFVNAQSQVQAQLAELSRKAMTAVMHAGLAARNRPGAAEMTAGTAVGSRAYAPPPARTPAPRAAASLHPAAGRTAPPLQAPAPRTAPPVQAPDRAAPHLQPPDGAAPVPSPALGEAHPEPAALTPQSPPAPRAVVTDAPDATISHPGTAPWTHVPPPPVTFATPVKQQPVAAGRSEVPARDVGHVADESKARLFAAQSDEYRPIGRTFTREELAIHAGGSIAEIFGEMFARQDTWVRQVRMPEGRLLLADRVVGIEAEPGSMKKGTVWTETDVEWGQWYLNYDASMPAGLVVEAGQADLFLISYLGADFENEGRRVYRLLGCELEYLGGMAHPGDVLQYEIKVVGHARVGKTRLFFFQYDGRVNGELRLKVRNGQAGFFTEDEMAMSMGVLWDAVDSGPPTPDAEARVDAPAIANPPRALSRAQVEGISRGEVWQTLGRGYEYAASHTRTPRIQSGDMLLLENVVEFDPRGGPWGRGYIRIENDLDPNAWYLNGHFKNDPCMPGTLMCEGCAQAMSLYMILMGYTLDRDGWIFQPVPGHGYEVKCRGQVSTSNKKLTYEIFVDEVVDGPIPTLYADILGTSDGLKIFHGRRVGLQLVPDWPLSSMPRLLEGFEEPHPERIVERDGFRYDFRSLLACAYGRPTDAFGPKAEIFCGTRHIARLPGPPYHFMSRVTRLDAQVASKDAYVEVEYDVPPDAWYFDANGNRTMPFCALLEIALQPCGWLSVFIGTPAGTDIDLYFRNLDGTGTVHAEVPPDAGILVTKSRLRSFSHIRNVVLVSFDVEVWAGDTLVYSLKTGFGYFPEDAFAMQPGLPASEAERAWLAAPTDFHVDLRSRPERYCGGALRLADPMLLMIDEIDGYWADGGSAGLGKVRARKTVDPAEWFFKAHFFQDPVQPGSLGCEAMLQLLQWWMLHTDQHAGIDAPRFEPLMIGESTTWRYRGQIVPRNQTISLELDVLEVGNDERGRFARGLTHVWVDGMRIYSYRCAMRIVSGGADTHVPPPHPGPGFFPAAREAYEAAFRSWADSPAPVAWRAGGAAAAPALAASVGVGADEPWESAEVVLDPERDGWLGDHRPTYTFPSLPLMSVADQIADAALTRARAGGLRSPVVTGFSDLRMTGWLFVEGPQRIKVRLRPASGTPGTYDAELLAWRDAKTAELSRWEPKARGLVTVAEAYDAPPSSLEPVRGGEALPGPYETARIFHGPAFQLLTRWSVTGEGSTAYMRTESESVPFGGLNQALLDNAVHGIVHDELWRWSDAIEHDQIAYPYRIQSLRFFGPPPRMAEVAEVRCETRFAGFDESRGSQRHRFPVFHIQMLAGSRLWLELYMIEISMPVIEEARDRIGRIRFIRDKAFYEGGGACTFDGATTRLDIQDLLKFEWLAKSMRYIYDVQAPEPQDALRHGVIKEHVSQRAKVHPYFIAIEPPDGDGEREHIAYSRKDPLTRYAFTYEQSDERIVVRESAPPVTNFDWLVDLARSVIKGERWPAEDLFLGMMRQFVRKVHIEDPDGIDALAGQGKIFLANHQTQVESPSVPFLLAPLTGSFIRMIAKAEHRTSWVGAVDQTARRYPGLGDKPEIIIYFDQTDRQSMFQILDTIRHQVRDEGASVFLHVEGELQRSCRTPVTRMSSVFVDLALELDVPIVPVRFTGGLPVEELDHTVDFPVGYAAQDWWVGKPISPQELSALPYAERRKHVMAAINGLGMSNLEETPNSPDHAFAARVAELRAAGLEEPAAVMVAGVERLDDVTPEAAALLEGLRSGELRVSDDPVGRWMAELAGLIYGEAGPRIVIG